MINFAHRGSSLNYPENSMKAFEEAIKEGATGIELDVHKTKDNILVVIHDEDVERTFLGKGLVKDYKLSELKRLKCRRNLFSEEEKTGIITLEELIALIKNYNLKINIELKTDEIHYENIEEDTLKLIEKYRVKDKVILSSFNKKSLIKVREIDKDIEVGYLVDDSLEGALEFMDKYNINAIHSNLKLLNLETIKLFKSNNKMINVYTVDSPKYMRILIKAGVDGIFTNTPKLLKELCYENK